MEAWSEKQSYRMRSLETWSKRQVIGRGLRAHFARGIMKVMKLLMSVVSGKPSQKPAIKTRKQALTKKLTTQTLHSQSESHTH